MAYLDKDVVLNRLQEMLGNGERRSGNLWAVRAKISLNLACEVADVASALCLVSDRLLSWGLRRLAKH